MAADEVERRLAEFRMSLRRTGVVTGISGTKVFVSINNGTPMLLPKLSHYAPTVNDTVEVLGPPPYLVLGKPG